LDIAKKTLKIMTAKKILSIVFLSACITMQGNVMQNEGTMDRNDKSTELCTTFVDIFDCEYQEKICFNVPCKPDKPHEAAPSVTEPLEDANPDSLNTRRNLFEWQNRAGGWFKYLIRWISLVIEFS
jgi:hypothetical protein